MNEHAALCTKLRLHSELGQTAEDAERLAGFALEAITFIRAIGRSTDPFPRTLAAQSFLERHGIPLTEDGDE